MALADQIARFVVDTHFDHIPRETVSFTKHLCSKIVAAMLTGARSAAGEKIVEYVRSRASPADVWAIGTSCRCSLEDAVFINGVTSHAAELEDDQFPSATSDITVFPVVFPLAEKLRLTGRALLEASVLGLEIMNRVGMFPLSSKGITDLPFYGVIGAAVTAAKALKLNPVQLKNAIGIALGRASGFIVNFGTDAHYIESAAACCDGLMAATLARQGMSGSADLERWLEQLLAGQEFDLTRIVDGLGGDDWRVHEIWVKKYPCCFLTHRHIDMMLETQSERKLQYQDIACIEIDVGPVDHTCNRPRPEDPEDARFSFHHIMAALMLDGDVDSHHFSWEKLADPRFQEAWKKVCVTNHPSWPSEFMSGVAGLTVTLKNGERIVKERAQALGGPKFPLTSVQFMNLYEKYTSHTLNAAEIERTWLVISELEHVDDLGKLVDRLVFLK